MFNLSMKCLKMEKKLIDIGTHKLQVVISEIPSKATIILEAGGGDSSAYYHDLQDTLASRAHMRVVSYDRSGFGESELGPEKFNAIDEVQALRKCLELQGIEGNLIIVGHSYGGYLAQIFTALYPELVIGLVLVDPMNILFIDTIGLETLNAATPYFENPTENHEKAGNRMVDSFSESLDFIRGKKLPKELPVYLITAENFPQVPELWRKCHTELMENSDLHKMVIAEGTTHMIWQEKPEFVQDIILKLIKSNNLG